MKSLEQLFERLLWSSRLLVVPAVVASLLTALGVFLFVSVDVCKLFGEIAHYVAPGLDATARADLRADLVGHVISVVDGYLLATVLLIFSFGLYELFVSDLDHARGQSASSRILVVESLDDLKGRLAKVILMILVVTVFERALKLHVENAGDLAMMASSIAAIGLGLYLSHKAESAH